ncbi:metallophosphoesterase [Gudongella sp. DL1XJH-153]|uniref:metallophosphoesterase n=1 Tax=Gudongella sp. DL1XJH-153 TaxID=3409804 RepID=UPI003BB4D957
MASVRRIINSILGRVHIEVELTDSDRLRLLHISDTPSTLYPEIKRIIKVLKPDYIVHTGDIADDIKLHMHPSYLNRYKHEARKMLRILNSSSAKELYLSLGNHDNLEFVKKHAGRIHVIEDKKLLQIDDKAFAISHYSDHLSDIEADIYLFGHDLSIESQSIGDKVYLNGISAIHLIDVGTLDIVKLKYPAGTDNERLKRRKTNL